jgi:hypothetical protein
LFFFPEILIPSYIYVLMHLPCYNLTHLRVSPNSLNVTCSCHDIDEKFLIWHLTTNTHSITIVTHILIELTSNFVILL